ncbi:MAG: phosphoribosylformylglycinamidine synthase subunit PurS [Acidimicrobiales bacterium]
MTMPIAAGEHGPTGGPGGISYSVLVRVRLQPGIADPEGATIERALGTLGFDDVARVEVSKAFGLEVTAGGPEEARARAGELCAALLANPVMERYEILSVAPAGGAVAPAGGGATPAGSAGALAGGGAVEIS